MKSTPEEKEIIKDIKEKKELRGISDDVVQNVLTEYLRKNRISLSNKSQKQKKILLKEVRSQLRLLAGRFQKSTKSKDSLLIHGKINSLLETHSSTAERISFYPAFRNLLSELKVTSLLDLGCGLNPIALASKKYVYYASDINEADLATVSNYFKTKGFKVSTFVLDIRKIQEPLPQTDVCLLLKLLDVVDPKHNLSENILKSIPSKKIIVSFSTKKLSGKKMNFPRRYWFEKLLAKLGYIYKTVESDNEIFYIITKIS